MLQVTRQYLWMLPGLRGLHHLQGQCVHRYLSGSGSLHGSNFINRAAWAKDGANVRPVLHGVSTNACQNTSLRLVSTSSHHQHSNTDSAGRPQADIQQNEDHLSLTLGGQTFRASFLWLRDHCKCPTCYEHSCKQNLVDIISLPDDIRPKQLGTEDDTLTITWIDDHVTTFSLQWLLENAPGQRLHRQIRGQISWKEGQRLQDQDEGVSGTGSQKQCQQLQLFLWDREAVERNPPPDVHIDELREGEGLRHVIENLHVYGFTFVSGLAPTKDSTEEAIRLISTPMHTLFGDIWQYQNDAEIADTGYTSLPLKNHTDHTYFNHAAGGLVLHCIHHDGEGGENTLVDGFHAAQRLQEMDPELYTTLLTCPVEAHYLDPTHDFRYQHKVLHHNALSNQLQQLRFNPHDRSDLSYLSYEDAQQFYKAYRALGRIIDSPENELRTKLQPGRMVVFDNFRLLHGRASFSGNRVMVGCYLIHDELQNLKRTVAGIEV